jgi:hypothetical protein
MRGDGALEEVSGRKCPGFLDPHGALGEIPFRLRYKVHLVFGSEEFWK